MRKTFYYLPIFLGLLSLALSIPLVALKFSTKTTTQQVATKATQNIQTASLFPQKANYKLGKEIPVGIIYESGGEKIKKVDVVLTFDPLITEVTTVSKGIIMDDYLTLKYDNKLGQVTIFGENTTEKAVNGILASLKFKPRKLGVVTFSFAPQSTVQKTIGAQFVITK